MTSQTVGSFQAARESDKYKSNVWPRGNQGGKRLITYKKKIVSITCTEQQLGLSDRN